ncbi:uncharacterized protein LOC121572296 isoform X2 [Coregonus clupeaformis]|uniref:uncharacterized protein LOC121572296 isoform X2 n=1 Tax=Coregonus clupeaformis TaxID=59861 RepID=UPI001E1C3D82|nr:uncharacterized protein LOC121572296 isoform X2 [Coregonus clupeaformis]
MEESTFTISFRKELNTRMGTLLSQTVDEVIDVMQASFTQLKKQLNDSLQMSAEKVVVNVCPSLKCRWVVVWVLCEKRYWLSKSQVADVIHRERTSTEDGESRVLQLAAEEAENEFVTYDCDDNDSTNTGHMQTTAAMAIPKQTQIHHKVAVDQASITPLHTCSLCGKSFDREWKLTRHREGKFTQVHHMEDRDHAWEDCNNTFKTP